MNHESKQVFSFAGFELDTAHRSLRREGKPVALHAKAFDLLAFLVENAGKVVSRDEILDVVWAGQFVEESNLTVQISALRKILGEPKNAPHFLLTIPGKGYKFVADVGNGKEIIIERHKVSRLVVEDEIEETENQTNGNGHHTAQIAETISAPGKTAPQVNGKSKNNLLVASAIGVLLVGVFGYWIYQRNIEQQNFASRWITPTQAMEPHQLTTNGKVSFAALSPDGNHFAYTVGQTDKPSLWYANTNGKQQIQIRPPEKGSYHGLTFAPDGNEIYYAASDEKNRQGTLFRIAVLGGVPQKVLSNIESPVTFSPDGKQLAFVRQDLKRRLSFLVIADAADGANERELAKRPMEKRFTPRGAAWSPDGKLIAVGVISGTQMSDEDVLLVNAQNGTAEKFGAMTFQQVRRVAWLKDGSGLFVNAIEKDVWDDRHLWLIEYPGGNAQKVTQDLFHYGMASLSISNDGTKLLSVSSVKASDIFVSPRDALTPGKKISANSLGKLDGAGGLAWTTDGRIVFSAFFDKTQVLWIMDADGGNARQLTQPGFLDRFPVVTKDNRYAVFHSTRGVGWNLWRIGLDGGNLKQLTTDGGSMRQFSADGQWILYSAVTPEGFRSIWKVSIDGGEPVRLTNQPSFYPSVSPDGKMFACSYRTADEKVQLGIFPIDGGEPLYSFDVPPKTSFDVGIRWTPDGQSLVYRDFGPSLRQQRLTGGAPEKILEFPDEIIYAFDWSFDGQQFAVAHGEDVRDVVLITNNRK